MRHWPSLLAVLVGCTGEPSTDDPTPPDTEAPVTDTGEPSPDADEDGHRVRDGDCDDDDPDTFPGAAEAESATDCMTDADGDGWGADTPAEGVSAGTDCDDGDAALQHDDADQDGYSTCDGDVDDGEATVYPGSPEVCGDSLDNDKDGLLDCEDADCVDHESCQEDCSDGIDNDLDGIEDCLDDDCWGQDPCTVVTSRVTGGTLQVRCGSHASWWSTQVFHDSYGSFQTSSYQRSAWTTFIASDLVGTARVQTVSGTQACSWQLDSIMESSVLGSFGWNRSSTWLGFRTSGGCGLDSLSYGAKFELLVPKMLDLDSSSPGVFVLEDDRGLTVRWFQGATTGMVSSSPSDGDSGTRTWASGSSDYRWGRTSRQRSWAVYLAAGESALFVVP